MTAVWTTPVPSSVVTKSPGSTVQAASDLPLEQGLEHETELFAGLFATGEKDEGVAAFFEDRDPEWKY